MNCDNSDDELDDEMNSFVKGAVTLATRTKRLSHVALNSLADVSTLSDITNTPPIHAPESKEQEGCCGTG
jgi:hypothetical protein